MYLLIILLILFCAHEMPVILYAVEESKKINDWSDVIGGKYFIAGG